jgi:hypothetical protein
LHNLTLHLTNAGLQVRRLIITHQETDNVDSIFGYGILKKKNVLSASARFQFAEGYGYIEMKRHLKRMQGVELQDCGEVDIYLNVNLK